MDNNRVSFSGFLFFLQLCFGDVQWQIPLLGDPSGWSPSSKHTNSSGNPWLFPVREWRRNGGFSWFSTSMLVYWCLLEVRESQIPIYNIPLNHYFWRLNPSRWWFSCSFPKHPHGNTAEDRNQETKWGSKMSIWAIHKLNQWHWILELIDLSTTYPQATNTIINHHW